MTSRAGEIGKRLDIIPYILQKKGACSLICLLTIESNCNTVMLYRYLVPKAEMVQRKTGKEGSFLGAIQVMPEAGEILRQRYDKK